MDWKIGEIKQINGEWYQCVEQPKKWEKTVCDLCAFHGIGNCELDKCSRTYRNDKKSVIFKKLEKVGEPYEYDGHIFQEYHVFEEPIFTENYATIREFGVNSKISIEIKQNKEDMEEKGQCCDNRFEIIAKAKEALLKETNIARDEQEIAVIDNILFRCWQMGWLDKYDDTKHSNSESIGKNLKPFDLKAAKAGKPVCTRDGRKARIICFDRRLFYKNVSYPILAVVERSDGEDDVCGYNEKGKVLIEDGAEYKDDLMMLPEKKEGWVNVYKKEQNRYVKGIFPSREIALNSISEKSREYIATIKITWEE